MKTKSLLFIGTLAGIALASQANAISFKYSDYRDVDLVAKTLTNTVGQDQVDNSFASGRFEISTPDADSYAWDKTGYNPLLEKITGAEVAFGFYDFSGGTPTLLADVHYFLGNDILPFVSGVAGTLTPTLIDLTIVTSTMGDLSGELLLDLSEDGFLNWKVALRDNYSGNVTLHWAALAADAESVPDSGSTLAMLGMAAFTGLVASRRLKRAVK